MLGFVFTLILSQISAPAFAQERLPSTPVALQNIRTLLQSDEPLNQYEGLNQMAHLQPPARELASDLFKLIHRMHHQYEHRGQPLDNHLLDLAQVAVFVVSPLPADPVIDFIQTVYKKEEWVLFNFTALLLAAQNETVREQMLSVIEQGLQSNDPEVKSFSVQVVEGALPYFSPKMREKVVLLLMRGVSLAQKGLQFTAIKILGEEGHSSAVLNLLIEKTQLPIHQDPNHYTRAAALLSLGHILKNFPTETHTTILPFLISAIPDSAPALALGGTLAHSAVPPLLQRLKKEPWRIGIIRALTKICIPEQEAEIVETLIATTPPKLLAYALDAMTILKGNPEKLGPFLKENRVNPDLEIQLKAAVVMIRYPEFQALGFQRLEEALKSSEKKEKLAALDRFPDIKGHSLFILSKLTEADSDSEPEVREKAGLIRFEIENTPLVTTPITPPPSLKVALDRTAQASPPPIPPVFESWDVAIHSLRSIFSMESIENIPYANWLDRTEKAESAESFNAYDLYAQIYFLTLFKKTGASPSALKTADKIKILLNRYLEYLRIRNAEGSIFPTYAYGAALVALGPDAGDEVLARFETWIADQRDPLILPYLAAQTTPLDESKIGSAGRNIPIYLALYLNRTRLKLDQTRNNAIPYLISAIENWHAHAGDLYQHVSRGGTHLGPHSIAPYYFYESLPYVTAAIKILQRDLTLTSDQAATLQKIKTELRVQIPQLIGPAGLRKVENRSQRQYSANEYDLSFYGLGLVPLFEKTDEGYQPGLENDFGIVVF